MTISDNYETIEGIEMLTLEGYAYKGHGGLEEMDLDFGGVRFRGSF